MGKKSSDDRTSRWSLSVVDEPVGTRIEAVCHDGRTRSYRRVAGGWYEPDSDTTESED